MNKKDAFYFVGLLIALTLTGCRTYGGYGTVEATSDALAAEMRQATDELQTAERELRMLEEVAAANPSLQSIAAEYGEWHDSHKALVTRLQTDISILVESESYLRLSRALGAILTEQRQIKDAYDVLTRQVEVALAPGMEVRHEPAIPGGLYGAYPAVYYRMWQYEITLTHVLRMHG